MAVPEKIADAAAEARHDEVGAELGEPVEDEAALGEARMGDDELGAADDEAAVKEEVEVERAGSPGLASDAPVEALEVEEEAKQVRGLEVGVQLGDGIEEGGLVLAAPGGGLDDAGGAAGGEGGEGGLEDGPAIAEVRSESDVRECAHRGFPGQGPGPARFPPPGAAAGAGGAGLRNRRRFAPRRGPATA